MATYRVYSIPAPGEPLEPQTRSLKSAVDDLSAEGVVVRMHAAGVCHTDVHLWHGYYRIGKNKDEVLWFSERPGMSYPKVPGHEIAGSVHAVGEHVSRLNVGDRVMVYPHIGCDKCNLCKAGDPHLCNHSRDLGFMEDGGYSEFVVVPHYRYIFKTPDNISDPLASMLPCSGLTAFSAIKKTFPVVKQVRRWGEEVRVMVVGLGGLGQWSLNLLKYCLDVEDVEHMKTIGVDVSKEKVDHALKSKLIDDGFQLKVTPTQATSDSVVTISQEVDRFITHFDGSKVHIVLDFVNTTETFEFSVSVLSQAGMLVMIGLHGGLGELKLSMAVLNSYTVTGSKTGSLSELAELTDLVTRHSIPAPPVQVYKLEDANKALHDLDKGLVLGRIILRPDSVDVS